MKSLYTSALYSFYDLDLILWHNIIQFREEVFIVEQGCMYLDVDGKDPHCHHVVFLHGDTLVAYARIVPPEWAVREQRGRNLPSIGRVLVRKKYRSQKLGYALMKYAIEQSGKIYGDSPIFISAQQHLKNFYSKLGFEVVGASYLEDKIPHLPMILQKK